MKLGKWLPAAESVVALMLLMMMMLLVRMVAWTPHRRAFPGESACTGSQAPLWPVGRPSPMATSLSCGLSMGGVWRWECEPRGVPRLSTGRTAACCCALMKRATPSRRRRDL